MFWFVSILLSSIQPGYDPVKQTLSALVLTPHGWLQTLDFCFFGMLVILFAMGLYNGINKRAGLELSTFLIILMGIGMIIIGVFPTDSGHVMSLHGKIHHCTVYVLGFIFPVSCFSLLPSLKADPRWRSLSIYTAVSGAMVFAFIIGWIYMTTAGLMDSWVGLYERAFTANAILWLEVMALRLLFLPSQSGNPESELGSLLSRGLSMSFWRNLGASAWVITDRWRSRKTRPARKPDVAEVSKYVAFGALLVLAVGNHYRTAKKPSRIDAACTDSVPVSPVVNTVLLWSAQKLGKRLGLDPIADLAISVVKDKE
jgi:hypothetical protein